jgi:hypothetical protein
MGCCAVGTCVNPDCRLCTVIAKIKEPVACGKPVAVAGKDTQPCGLVKGHSRRVACRPGRKGKREQAELS